MNTAKHTVFTALAASAVLALAPQAAQAQVDEAAFSEPSIDFDADAGMALPLNELKDFADPGFHAELGGSWWLNDRVALRLSAATDQFDAEASPSEENLPDMNFYFVGAGVELDLLEPRRDQDFSIGVGLNVGAATVDTDDFRFDPNLDEADLTFTYPYVNAGIEVGYEVTEMLHLELGTKTYLTMVDGLDWEPLAAMNVDADQPDRFFSQPVSLGIRLDLPPVG